MMLEFVQEKSLVLNLHRSFWAVVSSAVLSKMICTVTVGSFRKELTREQSENKPCSVCQWQWRLCVELSLFGKEPHTVFSSHSHLPSRLPGAIYRRTCRSWWTPPKASATRCCFWIFLGDFQTAGSETDQKQPSKTVKGAWSLIIVRKIICFYLVLCDLVVHENASIAWTYFSSAFFYCWVVLYVMYFFVCSWVLLKTQRYCTNYFISGSGFQQYITKLQSC